MPKPWDTNTLKSTVMTALPFWSVGDLNGGGRTELVIMRGHPSGADAKVFNGSQSGSPLILSFTSSGMKDIKAKILTGTKQKIVTPASLTLNDYNGDGRLDPLVGDSGPDFGTFPGSKQHLYLATASGKLASSPQYLGPKVFAHSSVSTDIDNDGDIDVYVGGARGPYLLINDGAGGFTLDTARLRYFNDGAVHNFAGSQFLDVNNDGYQDSVLFAQFDTTKSVVPLNDGTGSYANRTPMELPVGLFGRGTITGKNAWKGTQNWSNVKIDVNNDGFADLITAQTFMNTKAKAYYAGGKLQVLMNDGGKGFVDGTAERISGGTLAQKNSTNFLDPHVVDLNQDGWSDLIVTTITGGSTYGNRVFMNHGGHLVHDKSIPSTGVMTAVDTDHDGKLELVQLTDTFLGTKDTDGYGFFSPTLRTIELFFGTDEADTLRGWAGADIMKGGTGNDILYGRQGNDTLTGGTGEDVFVFNTKANADTNVDKITDFSVVDDAIWLDNNAFSSLGRGSIDAPAQLSAQKFWVGKAARDASDRIIYDKSIGALFFDADGNSAAAAVQIAQLSKGLKLTHKDFFVI